MGVSEGMGTRVVGCTVAYRPRFFRTNPSCHSTDENVCESPSCLDLPTLSFSVAESNCMIRLATWPNRLPCSNCRHSSVPPSPRQSTRRKLALPNSIAYGQVLLQARRDSWYHACPVQPHLSTY